MSTTPLSPLPLNSFEDACRFVESLDVSAMKLGLDRVRRLLDTLGNPQDSLPMVHIAGTNGKGSVTAMLASILKASGLTVGTFTSPHLVHLRERIAINGNPILPDDFTYEASQLKQHLEALDWPREDWPTYFEFLNVLAYQYFKRKGVELTVFEAGLGGRLDSTNVVRHPNLTVITHIGWDHMQHLGDTLGKIAAEKAGILKPGTPLVLGPTLPEEAEAVIRQQAEALEIPLTQADASPLSSTPGPQGTQQILDQRNGQTYALGLLGTYQTQNLATVLEAVQQLRQQGFIIPEAAIQTGLRQTHWPVRFQHLPQRRLVLDGSHNQDGFETLAESLKAYFPANLPSNKEQPLALMLSLRNTRPPEALLQPLSELGNIMQVIVTTGQPEHLYHSAADLSQSVQASFGPNVTLQVEPDPLQAFQALERWIEATPQGTGIVTGSLYTAGLLLSRL